MKHRILCLNSGSSSIKIALYDSVDLNRTIASGVINRIGMDRSTALLKVGNRISLDREVGIATHSDAARLILASLNQSSVGKPTACVHRLVHGGPYLICPVVITPKIRQELERVSYLAPLHTPNELDVVKAATEVYPDLPQIACFDTTFHQRMPEIAKRLPLPRTLWDEGVRKYGFHGLSYEFIVSHFESVRIGRTIIAHLGNGCSMVALRDGIPKDTTMSLTPTGGLMMGTRCGDLDPGVFLLLLRKSGISDLKEAARRIEHILNDDSGLLGVSGLSRSMEDLLRAESEFPPAKQAIELFCYSARKFIGSFWAVLGGVDTFVFTGGIGENSSDVRSRIIAGLPCFEGVLSDDLNHKNESIISKVGSHCTIRVIETNENLMMAKHALQLLVEGSVQEGLLEEGLR